MKLRFKKLVQGLGPNPIAGGGSIAGGIGGAPIAFSASGTVIFAGDSITLDTGTLQSGFRTPYFIDEIRIQAIGGQTALGVLGFQNWSGLGGFIKAKFQTGEYAFSKTSIPIGLYGPVFSRFDSGNEFSGVDGGGVATRRGYSYVRWPLPKPLWMGPGDVIQATIERDLTLGAAFSPIASAGVKVNITYIGRAIAVGSKRPEARQIPWVSFFQKDSDVPYISTTNEFRNPFTMPMITQRFTLRTLQSNDGVLQPLGLTDELSAGQTPATPAANGLFTDMRLYDSLGYAIVKEFAPVGVVFDTSRHAWTFSRSLGAREQFDLTLRSGNAAAALPGFFTQVGMVGYREEG